MKSKKTANSSLINKALDAERILTCGAIICTHCASGKLPILLARRDVPSRDGDSGWQFTCGIQSHEVEDAQLWRVDEVVMHDQSIEAIISSPVSSSFVRGEGGVAWTEER